MARFFIQPADVSDGKVTVSGSDAHHIARSLRMAVGQHITVCDGDGREYDCELIEIRDEYSICKICGEKAVTAEPPYRIRLFQALPKGDKLDTIIQKAVECGVTEIIPFESRNCIVKVKPEQESKKTERRERIAAEAAKQCGRGITPTVKDTISFEKMLELAADSDLALFCYENEKGYSIKDAIESISAEQLKNKGISIIIGSEGGFDNREAQAVISAGISPVGLGKRILRTETAPIFVLSCISYSFEI